MVKVLERRDGVWVSSEDKLTEFEDMTAEEVKFLGFEYDD